MNNNGYEKLSTDPNINDNIGKWLDTDKGKIYVI